MVSGEGSLPDLQMAAFSLCRHMNERETSKLSGISSYLHINPLKASSKTNLFPTGLISKYHHAGALGFNMRISWRHNSVHSTIHPARAVRNPEVMLKSYSPSPLLLYHHLWTLPPQYLSKLSDSPFLKPFPDSTYYYLISVLLQYSPNWPFHLLWSL